MHTLRIAWLLAALVMSHMVIAANKPFTGVFHGEGRACFGGLFVRTKTIEWNSSFIKCGPTKYELLDQNLAGEHPRVVYRIKDRRKRCGLEVVELKHDNEYFWTVNGYPSVEAYQKRDLPDWKDSALPERAVASCDMRKQ
jgi:hypothetical protein